MASDAPAHAPPAIPSRLVAAWYAPRLTPLAALLVPLSFVFAGATRLRRWLFARGLRRVERLPVPVVVVGNVSVGGTGKTPLVVALARDLAARGWHPGVVSRGFGASAAHGRVVQPSDAATEVGDEPLLIARKGLPIAVGARRPDAARVLLAAHPECDVIVSDDGLQHYALARDFEIAVVDGARGFGNGWRLPAGPLREGVARLREVDAIVVNGAEEGAVRGIGRPVARMRLEGRTFVNLRDPSRRAAVEAFAGRRVHALAGIGAPERFFATLRALGLDPVVHAYADHHRFVAADLELPDAEAILMTEKDAVKCEALADARCWMLPVEAALDGDLFDLVASALAARPKPRTAPARP